MRNGLYAIALGAVIAVSPAGAQDTTLSIGTGGPTGVYFPAGSAVCRLVNGGRRDHGLRCEAVQTGGTLDNLEKLRSGEMQFGIVQSDWQFHALNGTSIFEEIGPMEDLRAVASLHPEPFTVVALEDAGIATFEDLRGKRVNVGSPGSGGRGTLEVVLEAKGWTMADFAATTELEPDEMVDAMCAGEVDAIIYAVGHPSASVQQATAKCDAVFVEVVGADILRLIVKNPYYRAAMIPGGIYRGNPEPTPTFGVGATLVTRAGVPDEMVYAVTKAIFENFNRFKGLHPAFTALEPEEMAQDGLSAPLHPGAERYFREAELLP